jgi:hypothetical protein
VLKLVEGRAFDLVITWTETNGKEDIDLLRESVTYVRIFG